MVDRQQTILNEPSTSAFQGTQTEFGNVGTAAVLDSTTGILQGGVSILEEINRRDAQQQAEEVVIDEANKAADEALRGQREPLEPLTTGNPEVDRVIERDFTSLRRLNRAAAQGNISEGELGLRVEAKLKELRAKFPGFEEVINNRAKSTLGFDPRLSSLQLLDEQRSSQEADQRLILQMASQRGLVALNRDGTINMAATVDQLNSTLNLERTTSSFLARQDASAAQAAEAIIPAADRVFRPRVAELYRLKREFAGDDGIISPDERQILSQKHSELVTELNDVRLGLPPAASTDVQRVINGTFDSYSQALADFDPTGNLTEPDKQIAASLQVQEDLGKFAANQMFGPISFAPPVVLSLLQSDLSLQLLKDSVLGGEVSENFASLISTGLARANSRLQENRSPVQIWGDEIQGRTVSDDTTVNTQTRAQVNRLHADVVLNHTNLIAEEEGNAKEAYQNSIAGLGNTQGFQSAITHADAARKLATRFSSDTTLATVSSIEAPAVRVKAADTAIEYLHIQSAHEIRRTLNTPLLSDTDTTIRFNPITLRFSVEPDFSKLPEETSTIAQIGLTPSVGGLSLPSPSPTDIRQFDRTNLETQARRQEAQLNKWLEAMLNYKPFSSNSGVQDDVYLRELVRSLEPLGVQSSFTPTQQEQTTVTITE